MRFLLALAFVLSLLDSFAQAPQTEIVFLGSDHLAQLYRSGKANTDVLTGRNQRSLDSFTAAIVRYRPDLILVERLPEEQGAMDSLYALYRDGRLDLAQLEGGRSEVFQVAFRAAKLLQQDRVYCVNAPGGTSQGILDSGENIALYRQEGMELRQLVMEKQAALAEGRLSLYQYQRFINQPSTYNRVYHLRYITPARVRNGRFRNPDAAVDTAFIDERYIGAELISVFKNRDYKIYANIVQLQMARRPKRMLLLIGAAHIGSLRSIVRDDAAFRLVEAGTILR